jgi:hypothetical protein
MGQIVVVTGVGRATVHAFVAPADVADAAAVNTAADRIDQALGPIDVWHMRPRRRGTIMSVGSAPAYRSRRAGL